MGEEIAVAAADTELWKFAIENSVSFLVVVILFVGVLLLVLRSHNATVRGVATTSADAQRDCARIHGRVALDQSNAIRALSKQTQVGNQRSAAMIEVLRAQPAAYALAKHRAANGSYSDDELEKMRHRVRHADETMESAGNWSTDETIPSGDPDDLTVEERIMRLEAEAGTVSDPTVADDLLHRARILREEMLGIAVEPSPG